MNPAIVVPAYNRPIALKRLLADLQAAVYQGIPSLVISLEGEAHPEVVRIAEKFASDALSVRVIRQPKRLGLREHVIACGDLTAEYGSVVILEDDLSVDRYFYLYASNALAFYKKQERVAGIALYSQKYNEFAQLPFTPMANGYDTYPMRLACSWGQCWSHQQWFSFRKWCAGKTQAYLEGITHLPTAVKNWPESSWKKYFHGFMVEQEKDFIYPYQSYSTNCSDTGGTHIKTRSNSHQVALASPYRPNPEFTFCPASQREVFYDSFMEPCGEFVSRALGLSREEVEIDIQGTKPLSILKSKNYAVTIRNARDKKMMFDFSFRPPEFNLLAPKLCGKGDFWLCWSESLGSSEGFTGSVQRYGYYAQMNLMSKNILVAVCRSLPNRLLKKLFTSNIS